MLFDRNLEELRSYAPTLAEPEDFDGFWSSTLSQPGLGRLFESRPTETPLSRIEVRDISFAGFGGQAVKAWYLRPAGTAERLPCVVEFIGYGGGRGRPWDWLLYASAGFAHLVMDTRGQGGSWLSGDTPDDCGSGYGPASPGVMTRGIQSPENYYYRRLMTDAVGAVEAAAALPGVDPERIGAAGVSQGGGLSIAASALSKRLKAAAADVPFLCNFKRAVEITDNPPYNEIKNYLHVQYEREAETFRTLSYFDGVSFAARAKIPALFSAALMDLTCPPSTVFAAYNAWKGPKEIKVYPWNAHEGGASAQAGERLKFFTKTLKGA